MHTLQDGGWEIMDIETYFILYINAFFVLFGGGMNIDKHAIHKQPTIKHNFMFEP